MMVWNLEARRQRILAKDAGVLWAGFKRQRPPGKRRTMSQEQCDQLIEKAMSHEGIARETELFNLFLWLLWED